MSLAATDGVGASVGVVDGDRGVKPHVIFHMTSSVDGGLHPSRYTTSPGGDGRAWSGAYERLHARFDGQAWLVGRVTMAEMAKGSPHRPADAGSLARPLHRAAGAAAPYAIAVDAHGKLHFDKPDIGGDHLIVLLGGDVADGHLAELAADGVSYIVADGATLDLAAAMDALATAFGIERPLVEGGGAINGAFFAAGLVDESSVIVAPALDGGPAAGRIVTVEDSLAGRAELSLRSCEALEGGAVHLRYAVTPARAGQD